MIHANDARQLSQEADANIMYHANKIGEMIEAEAGLGKRCLALEHHHHQENDSFYIKKAPFYPPQLTKFQQLVMDYVKKCGYMYKIEPYTYYVGGGLGCLYDEPPKEETAYHIVVSW